MIRSLLQTAPVINVFSILYENIYSISEIAIKLGYSSESYFSRHFKQKTSMTPSEYGHLVNHDYNAINRDISSNSEN